MAEFRKVAEKKDLPDGRAIAVDLDGAEIALFRVNGRIFALSDTCPHRQGPLHQGLVEGTRVTCPWHFAQFDLETGRALGPPAEDGVACYDVRVDGDDILVAPRRGATP